MSQLGYIIAGLFSSAPVKEYSFNLANQTVNGQPITTEISVERSTVTPVFDAAGYREVPINTPAYVDGGLQANGAFTYAGANNTDLTNATNWAATGVNVVSAGNNLNVGWFDITETIGVSAHNLAATSTANTTASSALWWCVVLVDAANTTGRYIQLSNRGAGATFDLQTGAKTDCIVTASGGVTSAVGSYIREVSPGIFLLGICVNKTNANRSIIRLNIVDSLAVIDASAGATTNGTGRKMRVSLPTGAYSVRRCPFPFKMSTVNMAVGEDIIKFSPSLVSEMNSVCTVCMKYKFIQYQGVATDTQVLINKNAQANPLAHINVLQSLSFNEGALSILPKGITPRNVNGAVVYGWDAAASVVLYGHSSVNSANAVAAVAPTSEIRLGGATGFTALTGLITDVTLLNRLVTTAQADVLSGYSPNHIPLPNRMSGVNMAGIEFDGGPFWPALPLYDYFDAAGCKITRLPFLWEQVQPTINTALNEAFMTQIDTQVNAAVAVGTKVVLDPHNYGGRKIGGIDYKIGAPELPQSAFADLWTRLSNRYKTNPDVIFGLMNEPTGITAAVWFPAAQAAIDAIRATGSTNMIFVPGINFTSANAWMSMSAAGAATITDPGNNFVFEVHSYMDTDGSGTSPTNVTPGAWGRIREFTEWCRANGKRGYLGEWATINTQAGQFEINAICKYMTDNSDVWLAWTWWAAGSAWDPSYYYLVTPTGSPGAYVDRPLFSRIKPWIF